MLGKEGKKAAPLSNINCPSSSCAWETDKEPVGIYQKTVEEQEEMEQALVPDQVMDSPKDLH